MGLDISITSKKDLLCPHCGDVVKQEVVSCEASGGRVWYDFLEDIGYYVPYDQRTEETDWYGKDMVLTEAQVKKLYRFVTEHERDLYCGNAIRHLVMAADIEGETVVVNADW